eukprot:359648-Chlamydomonas_euryale.AAC.8
MQHTGVYMHDPSEVRLHTGRLVSAVRARARSVMKREAVHACACPEVCPAIRGLPLFNFAWKAPESISGWKELAGACPWGRAAAADVTCRPHMHVPHTGCLQRESARRLSRHVLDGPHAARLTIPQSSHRHIDTTSSSPTRSARTRRSARTGRVLASSYSYMPASSDTSCRGLGAIPQRLTPCLRNDAQRSDRSRSRGSMQAAQNQHNVKMGKHHSDHQAAEVLKAGQARLDRHSGKLPLSCAVPCWAGLG